MSETLVLDDLTFDLRRSPRRETVGITVERDGALVIRAPEACPQERIEQVAREKQFWVYRKLAEKERLFRPVREKEYVTGESFSYLGRSYRLQLVEPITGAEPPLRLVHGRFLLRRDAENPSKVFERWYTERGRAWLQPRVELFARRIGITSTAVEVRDLGFRWGSCNAQGGVNFHWRTILLPPSLVEYVVAHELVHLLVPDHGAEFWERLSRVMPDFRVRKEALREEAVVYL